MSIPVYTYSDVAVRMKSERVRLGLSLEQFAVLAGTDPDTYAKLELGDYLIPLDFVLGLADMGCDAQFIGMGERSFSQEISSQMPPAKLFSNLGWPDHDFRNAVALMLRSVNAVDAFLGKGRSMKSPELVAALMQATLTAELQSGAGEREEFIDKIVAGITDLADAVADLKNSKLHD